MKNLSKLLLGVFAGMFLMGCQAPYASHPQSKVVDESCAKLFVTAVASSDHNSVGTWNCLAISSQSDYFTRFGWENDGSIKKWMDAHFSNGSTEHVDAFYANPITVKDASSVQRKAFLYRLSTVRQDGTWDSTAYDSTGFTVLVDDSGKVVEVQ